MKIKRPYVMRARAESANGTRQRVLGAAIDELWSRGPSELRLEDVASRADVTVQTVLRIFGSKGDLVKSALPTVRRRVLRQRETAKPGDIDGTVHGLFDHYEQMGDFVIRSLAREHHDSELGEWLDRGRKTHRQSMQRQFAPQLAGRSDRRLVLDGLVVACDVYTWKLLRRDAGRSRKDAEWCVSMMVRRILETR